MLNAVSCNSWPVSILFCVELQAGFPLGRSASLGLFLEESFAIDGSHTAHAGGGDRLAVDLVRAVSGDEDARNIGFTAFREFEITSFIYGEDSGEKLGAGDQADSDENARTIQGGFGSRFKVLQTHAGDFVFGDIQYFQHLAVPDRLDFGMTQHAVCHDF